MIYVIENSLERQFELLQHICTLHKVEFCFWLYPDFDDTKFLGVEIVQSNLEPVTVYADGAIPFHTPKQLCTHEVLEKNKLSHSELRIGCDSVALYKHGENTWLACTIGHEGMCLVRDDAILHELNTVGFNATTDAPSWW